MTNAFAAAVMDEATLRAALDDSDIVPQALVQAQLSGDLALLKEIAPFISGPWSFQESVPEPLKAKVRASLVETLWSYAAEGRDPAPVAPNQLQELMSYGVGQTVPEDYIPLLIEETQLTGEDLRQVHWRTKPDAASLRDFKVIIIGAGLGGVVTGIRLKQLGVPFEILERDIDVGGTWLQNAYPGCGVDTPNHFYSYSFAPNFAWTRHFAKRDELLAYIKATAEKFGLGPHILFGQEVTHAKYDPDRAIWTVVTVAKDGASETRECNVVISAVGQLSRPSKPPIEGLERFEGPAFHTAEWRSDVDLRNKRVAIIGTGASAMQAAPSIADEVESLSIFQRSAHWINHNANYLREVTAGNKWALEHIPLFAKWYRFLLLWGSSDAFHASLHVDPAWSRPDLSLNAENHAFRQRLIDYAREQLGGDEVLLKKVIPTYPPWGKRMLRDNNWFKMLTRPNVDLVTAHIAEVTANAVVTKDGVAHPADVIILGTGFTASKMLWPMDIVGLEGKTIREVWGDDDPRAYLGISAPDFPNLLILYGPNTNLAHGGSNIFHAECQARYVVQAIREMIEKDYASLQVRRDVHDRFNEDTDRRTAAMVWAHPGVTSYYKNKANRVTSVSPYRLVDYWTLTREFKPEDYIIKLRDRPTVALGARARASSA